jgi:putative transposase
MVATARTQKRYDHRLRELVRTTQDVSLALQFGVPGSTARGWLATSSVEVVTADAFDMDSIQLQQEVLRLRSRIRKLVVLLRVLLAVLRISRFSFNQIRLPNGNDKHSLLRAIELARVSLPLRIDTTLIRLLDGSRARAEANRERNCEAFGLLSASLT